MAFAMTPLYCLSPDRERFSGSVAEDDDDVKTTKARRLGSHRSCSSVLLVRTLIRKGAVAGCRRGSAGWRKTSPAGGSIGGRRPPGNICVTRGAFRGCGPVRSSVRLRQRSPVDVIATSSDAAVVCMDMSHSAWRYYSSYRYHSELDAQKLSHYPDDISAYLGSKKFIIISGKSGKA